mmetsp:Transcript_1624/g.3509  ORF Transcript_1624/g.3509 Transcript_1624/m.3509 type:complete len:203 (+) Transcript_1624:514-1122(+)
MRLKAARISWSFRLATDDCRRFSSLCQSSTLSGFARRPHDSTQCLRNSLTLLLSSLLSTSIECSLRGASVLTSIFMQAWSKFDLNISSSPSSTSLSTCSSSWCFAKLPNRKFKFSSDRLSPTKVGFSPSSASSSSSEPNKSFLISLAIDSLSDASGLSALTSSSTFGSALIGSGVGCFSSSISIGIATGTVSWTTSASALRG